ncbi:MAG: hypothetical protein AB7V46_08775, partial [Thermomicrobiales bacterium]
MTPMPTSHEVPYEDLLDDAESDLEGGSGYDVTCPGCDSRLNGEPLFDRFRICPICSRHFWMPARERLALIVDPDTFRESNGELVSTDPLVFRDAAPRLDRAQGSKENPAHPYRESLVTGTAMIGGKEVVVIIVDFALLGEDIGVVAGEKLVLA